MLWGQKIFSFLMFSINPYNILRQWEKSKLSESYLFAKKINFNHLLYFFHLHLVHKFQNHDRIHYRTRIGKFRFPF